MNQDNTRNLIKILGRYQKRYPPLNYLVLGNHVLQLSRRHSAWLSCFGGRLGGKNKLFEEVLVDKFFQVPQEASAIGGLVSLTVVIRTVIFHSEKYRVALDRLRAPYSWLILDGVEDFVNR